MAILVSLPHGVCFERIGVVVDLAVKAAVAPDGSRLRCIRRRLQRGDAADAIAHDAHRAAGFASFRR